MNSAFVIIVLRLVHILGAIFWVGGALYNAVFLLPTVRALGPAGGQVMYQLGEVRRMPTRLLTAAILVIASGIWLMWLASGGFRNGWMGSGPGITFSIGGTLGIIGAIYGKLGPSRLAQRAGALAAAMQGAGGPPAPEQVAEMQRIQSRLPMAVNIATALVVLAASAMAVARYVP